MIESRPLVTAGNILTLNAGSSSVKFSVWHCESRTELSELFRGDFENIGTAPHLKVRVPGGDTIADKEFGKDGAELTHENLLDELFRWITRQHGERTLNAIGHRIVHGGTGFTAPVCIDDEVMEKLSKLVPLAPLHQPHNLSGIRACARLMPGVPQVACFDTAFHHTMGPLARRLGLPRAYDEEGVRRYGFHGLSYEFIAQRLRAIAPERRSARKTKETHAKYRARRSPALQHAQRLLRSVIQDGHENAENQRRYPR